MVAAEDVAADAGVANVGGDCVAYQEVVDAPADIALARAAAQTPPGVVPAFLLELAEGVKETGGDEVAKALALLRRKARAFGVGLGPREVDFLMRGVEVAAGDDRLVALQLLQVLQEERVQALCR